MASSASKQGSKPVDRAVKILQHIQVAPGSKYLDELKATARLICTRGKGILAADESTPTIGKRFQEINVQNTEENRRAYRELFFRTSGWGKYCSGVILYEETLNQKAADGTPFVDILRREGVVIGIKVDKGTQLIPGTDGETMTQGLDGLDKRCQEYYKKGARFAKWRAVLKIGPRSPSDMAIAENAHGLARYAQICQENGLVPIVEPEVLTDGEHDIETCAAATQKVWEAVIKALHDYNVVLEAVLLKPSMVLPGAQSKREGPSHFLVGTATPQRVAELTLQVLQRTIPPAIPGIFFLSGGQSEEEASINLNAINSLDTVKPWMLSFSYGRALQASALKAWKGQVANVVAAQAAFLERARANSEAQLGLYKPSANASSTATQRLYQADYKY